MTCALSCLPNPQTGQIHKIGMARAKKNTRLDSSEDISELAALQSSLYEEMKISFFINTTNILFIRKSPPPLHPV